MRETYKPHDYQKKATQFILDHPRCALWLEMGLGKTVATATAVAELMDRGEVGRVLVVAPLRVTQHTWPKELRKWKHLSHIPFRSLRGSVRERTAKLDRPFGGIDLINYDLLAWLCESLAGRPWPWQLTVFDESSKIKYPNTKRFRRLRNRRHHFDRVVELTGSPAPNGLLDVWAPMHLLGCDELGGNFGAYRDRFFEPEDYMGWRYNIRPGAEDRIHAAVEPYVLAMKAEDYLEVPEVVSSFLEVELPEANRAQYAALEEEMYLRLEEEEVLASNVAALLQKCLQVSNGAVYTGVAGQPGKPWKELHEEKLKVLDDVIEEAEGQPVLVPYLFQHDAERILKRYAFAEHFKAANVIDRWNRGEIRLLTGHPASMGHGLNLQDGGHILAWFGLPWSLEQYEQTIARLHRQGQERPVMVHHIITRGTVDYQVLTALLEKRTVQEVLKERLKERDEPDSALPHRPRLALPGAARRH